MEATRPAAPVRVRFGGGRVRTIGIMAVVGMTLLVATVLLDSASGAKGFTGVTLSGDTSGPRPVVGAPAPDIAATTTDGQKVSLSGFLGHPVWLTFGASWCGDCRAEAPDLEATFERFRSAGLVVLAISLQEDDQTVRDYAKRVGFTFTMVADPDTAIASRYRILGLPTHYFIGADGIIREVRLGGLPPAEMERLVRSILN